MNPKLGELVILLLAVTSKATAFDLSDDEAQDLAVVFLVLSIIVLLIIVIISIVLQRKLRKRPFTSSMRQGNKYNLEYTRSAKEKKFSDSFSVYGYYTDPEPIGSIYHTLDREKKIDQSNGNSYLEGQGKDQEGNHTYEIPKNKNTFTQNGNAYDNPEAVINGDERESGSDSEHDYEIADPTVIARGTLYENTEVIVNNKRAESSF